MTISENDIRAELSYAYLHAVASRAGFACQSMDRLADGLGIDAQLMVQEQLAPDSKFLDFSVHVQLKATSQRPVLKNGKYSFSLDLPLYDRLRVTKTTTPKILVLMLLPEAQDEWLSHTEDGLVSRRCAYWVSLRGAKASKNKSDQTVYVPRSQQFSSVALRELMVRFSRQQEVLYEA